MKYFNKQKLSVKFFVVISLFLLFTLITSAAIANVTTNPISSRQDRIVEQRHKIDRLQQTATKHHEKVRHTRKAASNLHTELENINHDLQRETVKINRLKVKLLSQEKLIQEQKQIKSRAAQKTKILKINVKKRLRAYYQTDSINVMNVLFSAASLSDLLNFQEYFKHLQQHDKQLLNDYLTKMHDLIQAENVLIEEKQQLTQIIKKLKVYEQQIKVIKQERLILLDRVKIEQNLYQRALKEIEAAATQHTAALKKLTARQLLQSPKKQRPPNFTNFAAQKGRLAPPAKGTVIITYHDRTTQGKSTITAYKRGIIIQTAPGSEVRAIYNGKIVYVGDLHGYGNLLIIDHGDQYYSLTARVKTFYKKEGEMVRTGEVLAIMNNQSDVMSENLHFEIRRGTKPENPLNWLNNTKLEIQTIRYE